MSDESERLDASGPTVSDRVLTALVTAPFLSILFLAALLWTGLDYYRQLDQETWVVTPATVSKFEVRHDHKYDYLEVAYTYARGEQRYAGDFTYTVRQLDFDEKRIPELESAYKAILNQPDAATCYVDPEHPDQSVLERAALTRWTAAKLILALGLLGWWVWMVREAWRASPMAEPTHIDFPEFVPMEPTVLHPIEDPTLRSPYSSSKFCLLILCGFTLGSDYNSSLPAWWVVLIMAIVLTLVFAMLTIPAWRARRRNPTSTLELDAAPIPAGGYFHGKLRLQKPVPIGTTFRLILRPHFGHAQSVWPQNDPDGSAVFPPLDAIVVASGTGAAVTSVPIQLPLPKIYTRNEQTFSPKHWHLHVFATIQNLDYQALFDLPLHGKVPGNAADEFLALPGRAESLSKYRLQTLRRARIFVQYTDDTLNIRLPAPRIPFRALLATSFGALLLLPFKLGIQFGTGTIVGFGVVLWSIAPWLSSTRLQVTRDAIVVRRGLLGIRRRRISPIGPTTYWSLHDDHIGTHLEVHPLGSRKRTLVKWLPNQYIAELLRDCICDFILTENRVEAIPAEDRRAG